MAYNIQNLNKTNKSYNYKMDKKIKRRIYEKNKKIKNMGCSEAEYDKYIECGNRMCELRKIPREKLTKENFNLIFELLKNKKEFSMKYMGKTEDNWIGNASLKSYEWSRRANHK